MGKIQRHEASIDYNIYGTGEITLLFIHGSYIDQTYWESQVQFFGEKYKIVTFDLPAHGKSSSERSKWSLEGFSRDALFIISELNLQNVILIGHSMGAEICLLAAGESEAIIGMISIDFFKQAVTRMPVDLVAQIMGSLTKDFVSANENYARTALLTENTPASIVDRVVNAYRAANKPMGMVIMPQMLDLYETEKELLPELDFKLHMINVDYQPTNEELLKKFTGNGYELRTLHGTCHFPMLEIPDQLNEALQIFILHIVAEGKNNG